MRSIAILADSRSFGTCRSCGARVEWATVDLTGRRLPFNPPIVLELSFLESPVVHVDMNKTRSHFATCPNAGKWRRK